VAPRIALLQTAGQDRRRLFRAFDHIVEYADRQTGSEAAIPASTWEFVIGRATPQEAARIGFTAYIRDDYDAAHAAWSRASASRHPDVTPWAAGCLDLLHGELGDRRDARPAAAPAANSQRLDDALRAVVDHGLLLVDRGDLEGARSAFEQAIASGHPDEAPRAALHLGVLLVQLGKLEDAGTAFGRAAISGHSDYAPWAIVALGSMLARLGAFADARQAYRRVIDSGHPDAGPVATRNLQALPPE
jgi:tetratricopeptide (TPR) repeat protein